MPNDYPDWSSNLDYSYTTLDSGTIPVGGQVTTYDVTGQATLIINASSFTGPFALIIEQLDVNFNVITEQTLTSINGDLFIVEIPITAVTVQIVAPAFSAGAVFIATVTNNPAPAIRAVTDTTIPRSFTISGPFVALTGKQLLPLDVGRKTTTFNGICTLSVGTIGVAGVIFLQWLNSAGTSFFAAVSPDIASGGVGLFQFSHPVVPVAWFFRPDTTLAGGTVSIQVIPPGG